ncbi:MAG: hypothetical protein AB7E31_10020 [Desulfitobacterium sp.]
MELQGLGSINLPIKNTGLQPGQRFLVEVIQKDPSGKAQIRLAGQVIPAMLEISVEPGGKFWASIHKIDENGIVLVRDNSNYPSKDMPIDSQRLERLYLEFASPKGKSLSNLLSAVLTDSKGAQVPADGKGTTVVTDGKGAPVVTDGKGAPVVADGKGAPVVADGKGAPVVADGKGTPVVADGKGAPVVTDGKSAPVVTDGKGAPVVTDGKGAPVVTDGKGTPVVTDGKGTPVTTDSKSTSVPIDGKSAPVPIDVKGTPAVIDGKSLPSNTVIQEASNDELFNLSGKEMITSFINNNVPQWSNLGTDGFLQLFMLFKGLGLDYERRLKNIETMKDGDIQNLQIELKKSLKGIILSLLNSSESTGNEKSLFSSLLERLTGQQILLQAGNPDAPFYLMEIPLQSEGELYTQTLAIKASRKGKKIDLDHCRLALHAETPTLGELGLEGWLYEGQLTLKLLSENQEKLQTLIEENYEPTRTIFHQMGITLHPIGVGQLKTAEEFHRFLKGELREGVNYQV